jgi:hypothetical protein
VHDAFNVDVVDGVIEADLGEVDLAEGQADWSGRDVAGGDLRRWLLEHADVSRIVVRGARVSGADGCLNLGDVRLPVALVLRECLVEPLLDLNHAEVGRLEIERCELRRGVRFENAKVHGGLRIGLGTRLGAVDGVSVAASHASFNGPIVVTGAATRLDGELRLLGGSVRGTLTIAGGAQVIADRDGWAVNADGLSITQDLFIEGEGTTLESGLRLEGATIGGTLTIRGGARIAADQHGRAVNADRLSVAQSLFVVGKGTRLEGGLRMLGGSIGGTLTIRGGAQIAAAHDGRAVNADGLSVTQDLFVVGAGTTLEGGLRLKGANIGGQLTIRGGAQIATDQHGWAVNADALTVAQELSVEGEGTRLEGGLRLKGANIGGQLSVRGGARIAGVVDLDSAAMAILTVRSGSIGGVLDLSHARLGRLDDDPEGWQQVEGGWRLSGITLGALSGTLHDRGRWSTRRRILWLKDDQAPSRRPFSQVAQLYREAGHRSQARKVAVAGERSTSSRWRRIWAGVTVGYGYQPWRAALVAVALVGIAWVAIAPLGDEPFTPIEAETEASCPDVYPCLNRAMYLTETVVPVVEFGQREAWRIDPYSRYATALQVGQHLLDGLGWILALLLLGAVTGVARKD